MKLKEQYFLHYSVPLGERLEEWRIAIATSDDLLTWEKVLTVEPEHPSEANGFCALGGILPGNWAHLFHPTYGNREKDAICHAWSDDGKNYLFYQSNQDGENSWCLSKVENGWNGSRPFIMPHFSINDPDVDGDGQWRPLRHIVVGGGKGNWVELGREVLGEWIRIRANGKAPHVTALFQYAAADRRPDESSKIFVGLAKVTDRAEPVVCSVPGVGGIRL